MNNIQKLLTEKAKYILDESYYCRRNTEDWAEVTKEDFDPAWENQSCIEVAKEAIIDTMKQIEGGIILDALNAYLLDARQRLEKPHLLGDIEKINLTERMMMCGRLIDLLK